MLHKAKILDRPIAAPCTFLFLNNIESFYRFIFVIQLYEIKTVLTWHYFITWDAAQKREFPKQQDKKGPWWLKDTGVFRPPQLQNHCDNWKGGSSFWRDDFLLKSCECVFGVRRLRERNNLLMVLHRQTEFT